MRLRPSIRLTTSNGYTIVVDTGPDFRQQALRSNMSRLDAVFITHQHADHLMGLDDIRRFSWIKEDPIDVWGNADVVKRLHTVYPYIKEQLSPGLAVPKVRFRHWQEPITIDGMTFTPFDVPHANLPCYGLRISNGTFDIGYVPDCSDLPPDALKKLQGVDMMILNALRMEPHPHHLSFDQSLSFLKQINASHSWLTHMGCPIDYDEATALLPDRCSLAYDGCIIDLNP